MIRRPAGGARPPRRGAALSPTGSRLALLAAAVLFSTGGAAVKATTLTSWQVAGLRSGVAAVALLLFAPAARRRWRRPDLALGVAFATTLVLFVTANKLTTAANAIFLQSTAPLYILFLAPWLLAEPVRRRDLAFLGALAAGMALFFVGVEPARATAVAPRLGNLLAAGSGLTWALTVIGMRRYGQGAGGAAEGVGPLVAGNLIAFLVCLGPALPLGGTATDWVLVAYLGIVQIALAYLLVSAGIRGVTALEASLLLLLEPVLNPLWAWWLHGEVPGGGPLAGGTLILAATALRTLLASHRAAAGPSG